MGWYKRARNRSSSPLLKNPLGLQPLPIQAISWIHGNGSLQIPCARPRGELVVVEPLRARPA